VCFELEAATGAAAAGAHTVEHAGAESAAAVAGVETAPATPAAGGTCEQARALAHRIVGPGRYMHRHVIGCRQAQETKVQNVVDDVEGNICQAPPP
jgi:hypothetical protein